jgi:predicted phosphodiesterase
MKLLVISDLHGDPETHAKLLTKEHDEAVQLGDLGWDLTYLKTLDPNTNKVIGGNHDIYTHKTRKAINNLFRRNDKFILPEQPHYLGVYGTHGPYYYVSGALSVNKNEKEAYGCWDYQEEMTLQQAETAMLSFYVERPEIVLSHDCPATASDMFLEKRIYSLTSAVLNKMYEYNPPKLWIFGHHHKAFDETLDGCRFICVPYRTGIIVDTENFTTEKIS